MNGNEMLQNAARLKACKKIYNVIGAVYMLVCPMYIFAALYFTLFPVGDPIYFLALDGPVFKGLLLYFGVSGTYKRSNLAAILAPTVMAVNIPVALLVGQGLGFGFNILIALFSVAAVLPTLLANQEYRRLEAAEGFPYFNERVEEQRKAPKEYIPEYPLKIKKGEDLFPEVDAYGDAPYNNAVPEEPSAKKDLMDGI